MAGDVIRLTREQLYQEVWATPMRVLASKFGLSDVGLAKVCRRHNIPRPPVGYWAKKEVGKAPARPPLPAVHDSRESGHIDFYPSNNSRRSDTVEFDPQVSALLDKESKLPPIVVPATLRNPHRLIVSTLAYWRAWEKHKKLNKPNVINTLPDPERNDVLDIDISDNVEPRALRIMQAWLLALEARRFVIHIDNEAYREGTTAAILDVSFMFRLRERLKRVPHDPKRAKREVQFYFRPPPWDLAFTGDLEIVVHCKTSFCIRTWKDTKRESLDSLLNNIVLWMIHYAGWVRAERSAEERRRQEREERERQRREAEETQRLEQEREDALIQESVDWEASRRLRAYLAELKAKSAPLPTANPSKEVQEVFDWFEWAEGVANRLDPIGRLNDQTLRKGTL